MASDNPVIFHGANIAELGEIFRMDRKEVRKRIEGVVPRGRRGVTEVYRIADVAPRLIKFDDTMTDIVSQVLATHHTDLPKMLSKEYWYAQNQRLHYLKATGDLWDTAAIVTLAGEAFKTLRLSLMLASDAVERETGLTPKQRQIIEDLIHEALNDAREKLVVQFNVSKFRTQGKAFAPKEGVAGAGPRPGGDSGADDDFREPRPGDADYL